MTKEQMKAYKNGITKKQFIAETLAHKKADNFIQGVYNEGLKGCAVGCALKSVAKIKGIQIEFNNHKEYETHLGIPKWLAHLEDRIFEGVSVERSKKWPLEFARAISEGSDLEKVKAPFMIYVMQSALKAFDNDKYPDIVQSINSVIDLYVIGEATTWDFIEARRQALAARSLYFDATTYAAAAAAYADAAVTYAYARSNTYEQLADKLLELLRECK